MLRCAGSGPVLVVLRRFFLVGVLVVYKQGSVEQLAYGTLGTLLYMVLQLSCSPFADVADDFLASTCRLGAKDRAGRLASRK